MDKEQLLRTIKAQLKAVGMTAAEASERAVGNRFLISNMGRERYGMPSVENLQSLCDVLGLDFHIGPRRLEPLAQADVAPDSEFAKIPVHDAMLAAGHGSDNGDTQSIGHLAFRRDWLAKIRLAPESAVLARADGDSMLPSIHPGDLLLIDQTQKTIEPRKRAPKDTRPSPIYAFLDGGSARVKRIERPDTDLLILQSDNPAYGPEFRLGLDIESLSIIGKVVWWGHTVRD